MKSRSYHDVSDLTPREFLIAIEGNIGSGKTTLVQNLIQLQREGKLSRLNFTIWNEPVDKWRNYEDEVTGEKVNWLKRFYEDPYQNLLPFQSIIKRTFEELHQKPVPSFVKVMERHMGSAKPFLDVAYSEGFANREYIRMFRKGLTDDLMWLRQPHMIIYIKTTPEVAFERLTARSQVVRAEESRVTLDYLRLVDQAHDHWLINEVMNTPIRTVNGNLPAKDVLAAVVDILSRFEPRYGYNRAKNPR